MPWVDLVWGWSAHSLLWCISWGIAWKAMGVSSCRKAGHVRACWICTRKLGSFHCSRYNIKDTKCLWQSFDSICISVINSLMPCWDLGLPCLTAPCSYRLLLLFTFLWILSRLKYPKAICCFRIILKMCTMTLWLIWGLSKIKNYLFASQLMFFAYCNFFFIKTINLIGWVMHHLEN